MHRSLFLFVFLLITTPSITFADLVWTGNGDGISLYQEANWLDNNGAVPGTDEINANTAVTAATGGTIRIDSGSGTPSNYSGNFVIGTNDLIVGGGKNLRSGGSGIQGTSSSLLIEENSTVNVQFILGMDVTVKGGSNLRFNGSGNPINNSDVNFLDVGSTLTFNNETYADFAAEHSGKISFQGMALEFGSDPFVFELGDNAFATAFNGVSGVQINFSTVPEPHSAIFLASAVGLFVFRRRK